MSAQISSDFPVLVSVGKALAFDVALPARRRLCDWRPRTHGGVVERLHDVPRNLGAAVVDGWSPVHHAVVIVNVGHRARLGWVGLV